MAAGSVSLGRLSCTAVAAAAATGAVVFGPMSATGAASLVLPASAAPSLGPLSTAGLVSASTLSAGAAVLPALAAAAQANTDWSGAAQMPRLAAQAVAVQTVQAQGSASLGLMASASSGSLFLVAHGASTFYDSVSSSVVFSVPAGGGAVLPSLSVSGIGLSSTQAFASVSLGTLSAASSSIPAFPAPARIARDRIARLSEGPRQAFFREVP